MDDESSEQKHWRTGIMRMRPPGSDDFKGEPHWGEYYKKYDRKLVDMFKEDYDETKLTYYRIKCSKNLEEGLAIYDKNTQSNRLEKIMEYAPASESMPYELEVGVLHRESKYRNEFGMKELWRVPREERKEYQRQKKIEWITKVRNGVTDEDYLELERLERASKQKKSDKL